MKRAYESIVKRLEAQIMKHVDEIRTKTPAESGLVASSSLVGRLKGTDGLRITPAAIVASLLCCATLVLGVRAFSKNELTAVGRETLPVPNLMTVPVVEPQQGANVSVFVAPSLRVSIPRAARSSGKGGGVINWTTVKPGGQPLKSIDMLLLEYDNAGVLASCEGRRVPISLSPGGQQSVYYVPQTQHKPENQLILTVSAVRDESGVQELDLGGLINAVGVLWSGGLPPQLTIREKLEDAVLFDPGICSRASGLAHILAQRGGRPVMGFLCDRYRNGFSFFYGQPAAK